MSASSVRTVLSISLVLYFVGLFVTTVDSADCSGLPNCVATTGCSSPTKCTTCNKFYGVKEVDASNAHCEECKKNAFCSECTNMTLCTKCNNTILYGPDKMGGVGTCSRCKENCQSCATSGGGSCDRCAQGYTLVAGSCGSCAENCATCPVNGAGMCDTCMNGYGLVDATKTCEMCKTNCIRCAANVNQCTVCNTSMPLAPAKDGSGMCLACAENCMNCTTPMNCTTCMDTFNKTMGMDGKFSCVSNSACPIEMRTVWTDMPVPGPPAVPAHQGNWTEVVIHHTFTDPCWTDDLCVERCNAVENYQKTALPKKYPTAVYNYFVGENGKCYTARGWKNQGEHVAGHNAVALGIAVIGTFTNRDPNAKAKKVLDMLFTQACLDYLHIDPNYKLYTHYDLVCTRCPGKNLRKWVEMHYASKWGGTTVNCPEGGRNFAKPMKK